MATKKPMKKFKRYDEGGPVEEAMAKQRGLDISNKEKPVGFFERIRAGNIDQPGTEAYNRFGAGRGRDRGESVSVNQPMPSTPAAPATPAASSRPLSDDMYSDYGPSAGRGSAGTSETMSPPVRGAPGTSETVKPTRQQNKPEAAVPRLRDTGPDRSSLINKPSLDKNYSNEGRGKPAPASKPSMDIPKMRDDAKAALDEDPSALMMGGGAAATAAAALLAKSKFGKLFKGAKGLADAKRLERPGTVAGKDFLVRDYEGAAKAGAKGAPKKQLGYSKDTDVSDVVPKKTSYRSETNPTKREDARANEAYEKLKELTRSSSGMKRGGAVKKYASGGMVSSASKRADGIASKGKTRCKIC